MMLVWHQDGKCNSELDIFSKEFTIKLISLLEKEGFFWSKKYKFAY
jgi:hypothetical protein